MAMTKLRAGGPVVALALTFAACGDDESAQPDTPVDEVTVEQILADPDAYDGSEIVVVEASAVPIEPEGGFVLEGEEGRILVSAPSGVPNLAAGEIGPVRAEVVRFTEPAADALGEELAGADEVADTPTDEGDPYLLLRALPASARDGGDGSQAATPELDEQKSELADVATQSDVDYGDKVMVAGKVSRLGRRAFVLEAEGERLLIVPRSERRKPLEEGAVVRARGTVTRVPAGDDTSIVGERELFDDFEGEPSLAATSFAVVD